jgi:hypothetical protein
MKLVLRFFFVIAIVGTSACGRGNKLPAAAGPPPSIPMPPPEQLFYDNGGGIRDSTRLVIRDAQSFSTQWARATSSQTSPLPMPNIDFTGQMVVLVAAGRKTPEDQIHVDSLRVSDEMTPDGSKEKTLTIVVRSVLPCRVLRTPAYPLEIVSVKRFTGPVRFHETKHPGNCGGIDRP